MPPLLQKDITSEYLALFKDRLRELRKEKTKPNIAERNAQKFAIKMVTLKYLKDVTVINKAEVWNMIYAAHVGRKAGVLIPRETVEKVISADQSWKKSSGHAFEEVVKEMANEALVGTDISVLLQRDLHDVINKGYLKNDSRDIDWLKKQMAGGVFDLFVIKNNTVFGCVQTKTSIRDRVTRDREPSTNAMGRFFWSIAFVLDGDFLRLPKFKAMVNGGTVEFSNNGWHAMYVYSYPDPAIITDRIVALDPALSIFKENAVSAANEWFGRGRQWMTRDWRPGAPGQNHTS